jgi:hypothetical protein
MDAMLILKLALGSAFFIVLICIVFFLVECIRIVSQFRKVAERVQMLTDVKGWLDFFSFVNRKKRRR